MIGTDLNLTLPDAGQTIATNTARTATCLAALEAAVADKATPAVISINAPLEMNGNALTEVSSAVFVSGNLSSTPGSLFYSGGDWYLVDSVGTIQITDNGAVNAAGIGGIVGDYGGVNPAKVSFDDASGEYRFTEDTGVYADLVADDLVLMGSAGSVRFSVDAAITTARTINIKSIPAAGCSFLVYDASDSSLKDGAAVDVTNELVSTNSITASDFKHTTVRSARFSMGNGNAAYLSNCGADSTGHHIVSTSSTWVWKGTALPLRAGDRITKIGVYVSTAVSGNIALQLEKTSDSAIGAGVHTYIFNPGTTAGLYSQAVAAPQTIAADEFYYLRINGDANGVTVRSVYIEWTHP